MKLPPNKKGGIYRRSDTSLLWMRWYDAAGKEHLASTGTRDEVKATRLLTALQRKVRAELETGLAPSGPLTLRRYAEKWIADRKARGIASAQDDEARLRHALPVLGDFPLADVTHGQVRAFVHALEARAFTHQRKDGSVETSRLAPRTVRHVYAALRVMYNDAIADEVVDRSPCNLRQRRKELPKGRDADPSWRATAIFTRAEAEALISDERIDERRRVLYGLIFLGGLRINEVTPRRFRDYDAEALPLGRLTVGTAFSRKHKKEKATKTEEPREVPVHPTLAVMLAEWKLGGWERTYGRRPEAGDLLMPRAPHAGRTKDTLFLDCTVALEHFHADARDLGLRERRLHDARRTFITLAQTDGAGVPGFDRHILRLVTHGAEGSVMDLYTSHPWATLCAQVSPLKLERRTHRVLRLPVATGTYGGAPDASATVLLHPPASTENEGGIGMHGTGLEAGHSRSPRLSSASSGSNSPRLSPVVPPEDSPDTEGCSKRSSDAGEAATQSPQRNSEE